MKNWGALVGLLASIGIAVAAPASAQDARVEAAKKEGKVVWYTSLALPTAEKWRSCSRYRAPSASSSA